VARFGAGCFPTLALWAALGALHYRLMTPAVEPMPRLGIAAISGMLLALGLLSFWGLLRGHGRGEASREALLRRARSGQAPSQDGPAMASGTVRALAAALTAPLSGEACVGYLYRMFYETRDADGRHEVPVYWGFASRPFALDSSTVRMRVLAVPRLLLPAERRDGPEAVARARRLVAETGFEAARFGGLAPAATALEMAKVMFTDDDGEARCDWKSGEEGRDPQDLILEETVLPVGAVASAFGAWSAGRGALVAQDAAAGVVAVSVVLGPPEGLLQQDTGAPASVGSYLVSAIVLTALGIGLVWFAIKILPTLH